MVGAPVVVYGASGRAGRQVCRYLHRLGVPFVAAGRDGARVARVLARHLPEGVRPAVAEVEHTVGALTGLLSGARVVCNTVGPFTRSGYAVVEAAAAAGVHYLDTACEQDWLLHTRPRWGASFAAAGLLLAPGVGHTATTGEIATRIALATAPGLDTVEIRSFWAGTPGPAGVRTLAGLATTDAFHLSGNVWTRWDPGTRFDVPVPGHPERATALPWGGLGTPVWFADDPRVTTCRAVAGALDRPVAEQVLSATALVTGSVVPLPRNRWAPHLERIAAAAHAAMPAQAGTGPARTVDAVRATGPQAGVHVVLEGIGHHAQTGLLQAWSARRLLDGPPRRTGFASACQAFGHEALRGALGAREWSSRS